MGYDATIYYKQGTKKSKIEDFLILLGYKKFNKEIYYHYNNDDYKSLCYVHATFNNNSDVIQVSLRTLIHCSDYDLYFMNKTLREMRRFFDCYFYSDEGKCRYFKHDDIKTKAEAGCYKAFFNLENEFTTLRLFIQLLENNDMYKNFPTDMVGRLNNPFYKIRAMALPYLATIIEEYFRETYLALLKYSNKKDKILKNIRISNNGINGDEEIEAIFSRSLSFQNAKRIVDNFKELDSNITIHGVLSKPYRRRKETLFVTLDRVLNKRHSFIHSNLVDLFYENSDLEKDISSIEVALERVFEHLCNLYDWEYFKN